MNQTLRISCRLLTMWGCMTQAGEALLAAVSIRMAVHMAVSTLRQV